MHAVDRGGADFIELGMPFSDPLAEGLTIQMSSSVALSNGVTMDFTFKTVSEFRSQSDTPLVLMGYVNPVMQYGVSNFFDACRSTGVDAVILPDFPLDERLSIRAHAREHEVDVVHLVAPTTSDERMRTIDARSDGFVYAVSMTGLTGTAIPDPSVVNEYLARVSRNVQINPVLVGFGISTAQDVSELSRHTDGCIVGSAVIRLVDQLWQNDDLTKTDRENRITSYIAELAEALKDPVASDPESSNFRRP